MKREFLRGLGIEDAETIKAIMDQAAAELDVEKDKAIDLKNERDQAQAELNKFKDFDVEKIQKELDDEKQRASTLEEEYSKYKRDVLLEKALEKSGTHNPKDLTGFLDFEKLKFDDDKIEGLDDQIEELKKSKFYLFKEEEKPKEPKEKKFQSHEPPSGDNPKPKEAESLAEALKQYYSDKKGD